MAIDKSKPILFLGCERSWQEVFEYYDMIRDAYNNYVSKKCEVMTETRRLYVISFKDRVDSVAKLLGIDNRVSLPTNIDKIQKNKQKETNEE
jgi:hypothetical protein